MVKEKICTVCGSAFECGANDEPGKCWCSALPNIVPYDDKAECMCPVCLAGKIESMKEEAKLPPLNKTV